MTSTAAAPMTIALAARDIWGITRRNLLRTIRTPQVVLIIVQPVMLLLLFRYVLGGAIHVPGIKYVNFVVPAVFLEAVVVGGMATAIGLAEDLQSGLIDRFRSLPMARSAVLAGRTAADLSRSVLALTCMVALGVLVGFRFHNTVPACVAGLALVMAFGYSFSWFYATVGLAVKDPETAQSASVLPFFILVFASSAIVPVSTMPGWLQPFARSQPVSVTINAVRALLEGGPVYHWLWQSLAWCLVMVAVFFTISLRLYRQVTA
jgi:ABC transporter DrrB family efflux protein